MTAISCDFDGDELIPTTTGRVWSVLKIKVHFKISASLLTTLITAKMFAIIGSPFGEGTERGLGERQIDSRKKGHKSGKQEKERFTSKKLSLNLSRNPEGAH